MKFAFALLVFGLSPSLSFCQQNEDGSTTISAQVIPPETTSSSVLSPPDVPSATNRRPSIVSGQSGAAGEQPIAPPTVNSGPESGSGPGIPPLATLRTQSGTVPGFMQRAIQRQNSTILSGRVTSGVRRSSRGNDMAGRLEFLTNALMFDSNGDQQLAANELRNLGLVLLFQQNNFASSVFGNANAGRSLSINSGQPGFGNVIRGTGTGAFSIGNGADFRGTNTIVSAGTSLQEILFLLIQLLLLFDNNGDSQLSTAELNLLAASLQANNFSLLNAISNPVN